VVRRLTDQEFIAKPGTATDGPSGLPSSGWVAALAMFGPGGTYHGTGSGKWGGVPFGA
jgi:hypothetical protein